MYTEITLLEYVHSFPHRMQYFHFNGQTLMFQLAQENRNDGNSRQTRVFVSLIDLLRWTIWLEKYLRSLICQQFHFNTFI